MCLILICSFFSFFFLQKLNNLLGVGVVDNLADIRWYRVRVVNNYEDTVST